LHAADYSEIAAYPKEKCELCRMIQAMPYEYDRCVASDKVACKSALDKKGTHIYRCRYGMSESVSPLYNFGTLTGFLMMGQVYEEGIDRNALALPISTYYGREAVAKLTDKIPTVSPEMLPSFIRVMTICAQYLTLSNAIPTNRPSIAELAKQYISRNYQDKLGIKKICTEVGCSKSALITAFRREYGTTVNSYITEVRLEEAVRMIEMGDYKIGEIAEACGFSDQSYFSKVFSAKYGVPPSEYEKKLAEKPPFWR
jgi:AraC-like DNA-binding protein